MSHNRHSCYRAPIAQALAVVLLIASSGTQAQTPCFKPLTDRTSQNPGDWKDLTALDPTDSAHPVQKADGVKNFLPIRKGRGDKINLDYYEMRFNAPVNTSISDFFQQLRQKFPELSKDQSDDYNFHPYRGSANANDAAATRNQSLWKQSVPTGALMTFQLMDVTFARSLDSVSFNIKRQNGDVQATCATGTDLVFSTVETEKDGDHPVSGNRGFGLKDDGDGTWTFYSMGADRETDFFPNKWNLTQIAFGKNVFQMGEAFWDSFYGQLTKTLNERKLAPQPLFINSCRYNYDPNQGPVLGSPPKCRSGAAGVPPSDPFPIIP